MNQSQESNNMTNLKSNIAVELTVDCETIEEPSQRHRIWITRSGEVLTPDHHSNSEAVMIALGGKLTNACAYWKAIPLCLDSKAESVSFKVPNMKNWIITNNPFWSSKVCWVALSGIIGTAIYNQLDPEMALYHAKVFQKYDYTGNNKSLVNELDYLQFPAHRAGGFRRNRVTTAKELEELIESGLPINRVATAAALDLRADQITRAIQVLKGFRLPLDLVVNIGYSLPGERIESFVEQLDADKANSLSNRLSKLSDKASELTDDQIEDFLLGKIE